MTPSPLTPEQVADLVKRLQKFAPPGWHPGHTLPLALEAASALDRLLATLSAAEEENERLRAALAKREARLEIDHAFKLDPDDPEKFVRVEVPEADRDKWPDGITARDCTIELAEEEIDALKARADSLSRDLAEARKALEFYANPDIYKPHPHGPGFDDRDLSFHARAALSKEPSDGTEIEEMKMMTEAQIKHMVDRFLTWRLPENFSPDAGISFKAAFNEHTAHPMKHEPVGTNLLTADQTTAMVRHMIKGLP